MQAGGDGHQLLYAIAEKGGAVSRDRAASVPDILSGLQSRFDDDIRVLQLQPPFGAGATESSRGIQVPRGELLRRQRAANSRE